MTQKKSTKPKQVPETSIGSQFDENRCPESQDDLQKPRDPALVCAELMIGRAKESSLSNGKIPKGSLVIIEIPSESWIEPIQTVLPASLLNTLGASDEDPESRRFRKWQEDFVIVERLDREKSREMLRDVSGALKQHKTTVVVTTDFETLIPENLKAVADHFLYLPLPDRELIEQLADEIGSGPLSKHPNSFKVEDITPEILRIANRPLQTSDGFLERILKLAGKTDADAPSAGIQMTDLAGMPELRKFADQLRDDIVDYKEGKIGWSDIDKGALISGPPGVGKTTSARAIAQHVGLSFFATSYAEWQSQGEGHLGDVIKAIRMVFRRARNSAPALIFIDELDAIISRTMGGAHREWWRPITACLLEELAGCDQREGVIVLAATNYPEMIDPALKRAGRLDQEIKIPLPGVNELAAIIRFYVKNNLNDEELLCLANLTYGKTGADIEKYIRGARRRARSAARDLCYVDVLTELAGETADLNDPIRRRVAIHEAGHALIITLSRPHNPPSISIARDGRASGSTLFSLGQDEMITIDTIDATLRMLLAGRAAEEVYFNDISSGAGGSAASDLAMATRVAALAEVSLGLGSSGLVWNELPEPHAMQTLLAVRPEVSAAINARLEMGYLAVRSTIAGHKALLKELAEQLLLKTILSPAQVYRILAEGGLFRKYGQMLH